MANRIIQGMLSAIIGAISFIAVKALVDGMDTSGWSSGETTIMCTVLPLAIAIMALVAVFAGLQKITGGA